MKAKEFYQISDLDIDNHNEIFAFAEAYRNKQLIIPLVSKRLEMRKKAITVFELTKGFTTQTTDNAMKTALEMAEYVMILTSDLDGQ